MTGPTAHSLMPLVYDPARLKRAARTLMRHRSAPGSDGMTWASYRRDLDVRIGDLAARIRSGTWEPGRVRLVTWSSWGKTMTIAVPTVEDRIVQRALRLAAEPVLVRDAYPMWMYGWRPQAGRVEAVAAAAAHLAAGRTWVADLDVAAATTGATVQQAVGWLARWIHDGTYLRLVRHVLDGLPSPLAPGSGLTPMLTNLRLSAVDEQLNGLRLVRLTDNYTAFTTSRTAAHAAAARITAALATQGISPNPAKSKVWQPNPEDLYLAG